MEDSRRFRVRYQLKLADLVRGRLRRTCYEWGVHEAKSDEPNVLLADLYDTFRTLPALLGIEILTIRRIAPRG
jgi:hypothetical protein